MDTKYGSFDLNPAADAARIPYNFVTGPGQFSTNLRISKSIGIGPRTRARGRRRFQRTASGGGGRGPGGGGPPGGGLGPGGLSSSGGRPPMLDQQASRRYSLNFTAMGRNIFNNVNLAPPVGVLESPLFGKSNALAGGFFSRLRRTAASTFKCHSTFEGSARIYTVERSCGFKNSLPRTQKSVPRSFYIKKTFLLLQN